MRKTTIAAATALALTLAGLSSPAPAMAQEVVTSLGARGPNPTWSPGPELEAMVREEVARRWGAEPEAIHLEWGRARGGDLPGSATAFALVGDGIGGNWIVDFTSTRPAQPTIRVWLRAGVEVLEAVAAGQLARDHTLEPGDIATSPGVHWGRTETVEPDQLVGWVTKRQIRSGDPLREPAIGPPLAVRSGESVRAVWNRGGVALTLEAKALGTAVVGGRVFVRTETGLRVEGTASAIGVVEIESPPEVR